MKHSLSVAVGKPPTTNGIVAYRKVKLRERLLERFLGPMRNVVLLVPGKTVDSITVTEIPEGGDKDE